MSWRKSIAGRQLQMDKSHLYLNGRIVGNDEVGKGKTFYVDSAVAGGSGQNPDEALATLDAAIGLCTANQGDKIVVMPNHAETVTGAGGITADVAGISIIGLGVGNQRPRFLMDGGTTVTFVVSAADVYVENLVFAGGHADAVRLFNITAAGFTAVAIEMVENVINENILTMFDFSSTVDGTCSNASIVGCRSIGVDAAALNMIKFSADADGVVIRDNFCIQSGGTNSALILCATGKDLTNLNCQWNFLQHAMTANDLLIDNDTTANTGIVAHNRCKHKDVTGVHVLIDIDGVGLFDNLSVSTDILSGFVHPAIDVDL